MGYRWLCSESTCIPKDLADLKKLRVEVANKLGVDAALLKELIPNKDEMTIMKIFTHSGDTVVVYNIQGNPAFFELDRLLYPTVYTLWRFPELLPVFTTWPPVFKKLLGGADLMLPGLIVKGQVTSKAVGGITLPKHAPCTIKLLGNKAPIAVGKTAMCTNDMYMSAMRGKGIVVIHTHNDQLWAFGNKSDPPTIDDPEMLEVVKCSNEEGSNEEGSEAADDPDQSNGVKCCDDEGDIGAACSGVCNGADAYPTEAEAGVEKLTLEDEGDELKGAEGEEEDDDDDDLWSPQEKMDDLLYSCFLCALKTKVKKSDLPLLASSFFRNHLKSSSPLSDTIDIKKSSYKKVSKFLKAMQSKGFIVVKELSKDVDSITEIHKDHIELREFQVPAFEERQEARVPTASAGDEFIPPEIVDMFFVNAALLDFFRLAGYSKGKALTAADVRKCLTDYINENNLKDDNKRGFVTLDGVLSDVVLNKGEYIEHLQWEDVINRTQAKMGAGYKLTTPGQAPIIKKGKLEPVVLNLAQRGGNKKVTLITNLEVFGINVDDFAHRVQIGRACSTAVNALPGKNQGLEVLVQGNQINFIADLLIDKYQLPRKYLQGLQKAPKPGKKKR